MPIPPPPTHSPANCAEYAADQHFPRPIPRPEFSSFSFTAKMGPKSADAADPGDESQLPLCIGAFLAPRIPLFFILFFPLYTLNFLLGSLTFRMSIGITAYFFGYVASIKKEAGKSDNTTDSSPYKMQAARLLPRCAASRDEVRYVFARANAVASSWRPR